MHVRGWSWARLRHECKQCALRWRKPGGRCPDEPKPARHIGIAQVEQAPPKATVATATGNIVRPYVLGKTNEGRFSD
jgi:hypothetical protein